MSVGGRQGSLTAFELPQNFEILRLQISSTEPPVQTNVQTLTMPKEHKHSRGRREEKKENKEKRKRETSGERVEGKKRRKSEPVEPTQDVEFLGTDNPEAPVGEEAERAERPFYGLLEDEEQEYFRRADELLELNDFPSDDERSMFLANVYKEADGKELKIACSQSCSRLMERLILLSNAGQKKRLFEKFAGNFPHLIQHRFASHCCETLFIQSAPVVTEELTADSKKKGGKAEEGEEAEATMESLFLQTLDELEGQMTFLLTDRFASHTLRVLLVILSGRPLEKSSTKTMLQSKRKEKVSIAGHDSSPTEFTLNKRSVPSSFQYAVEKIISDTIATMDTSFIRVLATHPTGNPTLQLLLELELTNANTKKGANSDSKTIISSLLPDEITAENSESATFINGLMYDPIGSRLLETICAFAPGKLFKQIYKTVFKDRIAAISRNEISSYVAIRVLSRISKEDLAEAVLAITPQILGLVERNRTVIIKVLLERCHVRGVDASALTNSISTAYGDVPESLVLKMACIEDINSLMTALQPTPTSEEDKAEATQAQPPKPTASQLHGSLLAQTMLAIPGPPSDLIQKSLLALPPQILLTLALYTTTTHIVQSALFPSVSNTVPFRRKLINSLLFPPSAGGEQEPVLVLALSSTGSHVLDALIVSTSSAPVAVKSDSTKPTPSSSPLFQIAERIAGSLTSHEQVLRDSFHGRIVWRNWNLDLFKRRRGDWVSKMKSTPTPIVVAVVAPEEAVADAEEPTKVNETKKSKKIADRYGKGKAQVPSGKTGIQLAREKFAAEKLSRLSQSRNEGSGANAQAIKG